jgi:hypothetical protein
MSGGTHTHPFLTRRASRRGRRSLSPHTKTWGGDGAPPPREARPRPVASCRKIKLLTHMSYWSIKRYLCRCRKAQWSRRIFSEALPHHIAEMPWLHRPSVLRHQLRLKRTSLRPRISATFIEGNLKIETLRKYSCSLSGSTSRRRSGLSETPNTVNITDLGTTPVRR